MVFFILISAHNDLFPEDHLLKCRGTVIALPDSSVLTHSFASRFCDGERLFGSVVLCEDGLGAGGPLEGLWVLVSMLDPLVNRGLEFDDVVEGSSSDALASDFGEEPLDEVEPGTGCRREVQCEAFVSRQPALHGRRLVGGVVVEDQMQIEMCGLSRSIVFRNDRNSSAR